jgi:hypothetical protein
MSPFPAIAHSPRLRGSFWSDETLSCVYSVSKRSGLFLGALALLVLIASAVGIRRLSFVRPGQGTPVRQRQPDGRRGMELTGVIGARHHAGPMAFSHDGTTLALPNRNERRVELLNLGTRREEVLISAFNKDEASPLRVSFSSRGRYLAVLYGTTGVVVWDLVAKSEQMFIPVILPAYVIDMAFADGDQAVVSIMAKFGGLDTKADRWD